MPKLVLGKILASGRQAFQAYLLGVHGCLRQCRGMRCCSTGDLGAAVQLCRCLHRSTAPACRKPYHGINFVIAHDGFTLHDLVAYNTKHNDANGEGNRDGSNDNFSWNCGVVRL